MWSGFLLPVRNTGCEVAVSPGCLLLMTHSLPCRGLCHLPEQVWTLELSTPPAALWPALSLIFHLLLWRRYHVFSFLILSSNSFLCSLQSSVAAPGLCFSKSFCKFRTFWETLKCERRLIKNTSPKQKYFPVFQTLKEWPPLANESASIIIIIFNAIGGHEIPAPGPWQPLQWNLFCSLSVATISLLAACWKCCLL